MAIDTNGLVNGLLNAVVEQITQAVMERLPYFKDLDGTLRGLRDGVTALDDRLRTVEQHLEILERNQALTVTSKLVDERMTTLERVVSDLSARAPMDTISKRLKEVEDKFGDCAMTDDLPDFDDFVKSEDIDQVVEDKVTENLPDMDEFVKRDDFDPQDYPSHDELLEAVLDAINKTLPKLRVTQED